MVYRASFDKFLEDLSCRLCDEEFVKSNNADLSRMNSLNWGANIDKDFYLSEDFKGHVMIETDTDKYIYNFADYEEFIDYCKEYCMQGFDLNDKYYIWVCPIFEGIEVENRETEELYECFETETEFILKEVKLWDMLLTD